MKPTKTENTPASLARLLIASAARLAGVAAAVACFHVSCSAGTFTVVASFTDSTGRGPGGDYGAPILSPDASTLYGTTLADGNTGFGGGTVFSVPTSGTNQTGIVKVLHDFAGTDGSEPICSLAQDGTNLFGVTSGGGANDGGVIFRVDTNGVAFKVLYQFGTNSSDGARPAGGLIFTEGALYGTAGESGANDAGVVFRINTDGTGYTFYSLPSGEGSPRGTLSTGVPGSLFGTVQTAVFFTPTNFSSFSLDCTGLVSPTGSVYVGEAIYGSDNLGTNDYGAIFSNANGDHAQPYLYNFTDGTDGSYPNPVLAVTDGSDTLLYGTCAGGGANGLGNIFHINADGTGFTVDHSFPSSATPDGSGPAQGLVAGGNGTLYGTASAGGDMSQNGGYGAGTVFSWTP